MIFLFIFLLQEEEGNEGNNKLRTIYLHEASMQVIVKHQNLRTLMPFLKARHIIEEKFLVLLQLQMKPRHQVTQ